jgi:hypothetical protein
MSDVAQRLLWLDGAPFSLADYPMYRAIYDGRFKSTLMMCGRQVAKSTSLANFIITESVSIPFFKEYYLSPTKEQTLTFSNLRVGKTLAYSPLVKKHFQSPEHSDRVLHRSYTNGSENGFTYACDDADRARGFSADRVLYDEFQDMLYDAVVPVVNACLKNSKYRYETYAGTPKSMEASIQYLWERSTQSEWVMKCSSCGKYNFVVSDKSLGKHGPICLNCGTVLNPRFGQWVDMKVTRPGDTALIKGFHIPRLIMPSDVPIANPGKEADAQSRWDDILRDYGLHSPARFRNEVLGVSDAIGQRLISLEELMALCGNRGGLHRTPQHGSKHMEGVTMAVAGVDWTGGGQAGISRTVLWVWGYVPAEQRLKVLYYRVYPNNNAVSDVKDIAEVCNNFNVALVVGDAGEGNLPNSMLREALGAHRTTAVQYGSQKTAMTWNGVDRFMLDRTTMIDNYIMLLKKQGVLYEDYPVMRVAIEDVLNVYEEVTLSGKKVWRHSPQLPDDCLHAQIFGWLALKIRLADTKFYQ